MRNEDDKKSEVIETMFGPAAPSLGWVPAPRYVLRRDRILHHLGRESTGRLLEIGCGSGALLRELSLAGFDCTGLETSAAARRLSMHFSTSSAPFEVFSEPESDWEEHFDVITTFEVLEHIKDDADALKKWSKWLRPNGRLILSVPSREKYWSDHDVWAGHCRRYERKQLTLLLEAAGFEVSVVESYGFPTANLLLPLRKVVSRRSIEESKIDAEDSHARTAASGVDRGVDVRMYPFVANPLGSAALAMACLAQRPFLKFDLGNGYLAVAFRRP